MEFEDVNVRDSAEGREELIRLTGQMSIPVIVVDEEVIRGFDKARLKDLLDL